MLVYSYLLNIHFMEEAPRKRTTQKQIDESGSAGLSMYEEAKNRIQGTKKPEGSYPVAGKEIPLKQSDRRGKTNTPNKKYVPLPEPNRKPGQEAG
ncbi:MAG: hypothetical protein WCJ19_05045 [bacterium]